MSEHPDTEERQEERIRIWQSNCRKSLINQLHVVNHLNPDIYDICAIQEPYMDFKGDSRAPNGWKVIYTPGRNKEETTIRSIILISPKLLTSNWTELNINLPDVSVVQIWGNFGTLRIFNIY